MATRKLKCSQMDDLNVQQGAIFSRSLNDYDRAIFYKIFAVRMSVLTTFIVKKEYKPEPNRNLEKTNRNRTMSSESLMCNVFRSNSHF